MARKHDALGGCAILLMLGCAVDGSDTGGHAPPPLAIAQAGTSVSFRLAGTQAAADGALNVAGESNPSTPLQAGASVITTSPGTGGVFDFGPTVINTVQQVRWSVTNVGTETTAPLDLSASNDLQFSASLPSCPPLAPAQSCDVTVTYAPGESLEFHSGTFSVTGFPASAFTFTGSGRPPFSAEFP